jgi:uncharacterized protein
LKIVLDTNIVLDWLVFEDPLTAVLRTAVEKKHVRVVRNDLTTDELRRVLGYPKLKIAIDRQAEILGRYRSCAERAVMPDGFARSELLLPDSFPPCRDRDDDHFLAMAYHIHADWLVTKDKVILKLRKKAARFGVRIANLRDINATLASLEIES